MSIFATIGMHLLSDLRPAKESHNSLHLPKQLISEEDKHTKIQLN